jgi:hypothetical protein
MISALPTGAQEVARQQEQNRQLAEALRQLRDEQVSTQARYTSNHSLRIFYCLLSAVCYLLSTVCCLLSAA